jgi:hypothetical protein
MSESRNPNVPTESSPVALDPTATFAGFSAKVASEVVRLYSVEKKSRKDVASALRISPEAVERIAWAVEPAAFPSLRFDCSPENVALRAKSPDPFSAGKSPRFDRIAARAGVSVGKVREAYAAGTGADSSTRYPGRGRRNAEARFGPADPESFAPVREAIRTAKAEGRRGDAAIAARASELLAERAEAERAEATAAEAAQSKAATPKRARSAK